MGRWVEEEQYELVPVQLAKAQAEVKPQTAQVDLSDWYDGPVQKFELYLLKLLKITEFTPQSLTMALRLWLDDEDDGYRILVSKSGRAEYAHTSMFGNITLRLIREGKMTEEQAEMLWDSIDDMIANY